MQQLGQPGQFGLENQGITNYGTAYWNLSPTELVEQVILRKEGLLSADGAVVVNTGHHTGRSPNDKYVVRQGDQTDEIIWWGKINQPLSVDQFERLHQKMLGYLQNRDFFVQDLNVGAHPNYTIPIRIITEKAWSAIFSNNLFIRIAKDQIPNHVPLFTVIHCPDFLANPKEDGIGSSTFIVLNLKERLILIGGSAYAGEIKKSIFSVMNYLLPQKGVLSMHCSANVGVKGDVALFFGLSGTGKTTLSSDMERSLIGDDEHGWSQEGIFNFEGGCYAKTIRLNPKYEPIIWDAAHRFGTVLENVVCNPTTRDIDLDDESLTENTRGAYPITIVPNHVSEGYAGHPKNIFFLTADAFGVMPPIARLSPAQAMYYFLSGYTSKLAGTERGLGKEPQATYSTCFGAPFLPLYPRVYADLLGKFIQEHEVNVWLLNTGWTGGPYGVGQRFSLPYTRAMVKAALTGELESVQYVQEKYFGLFIPVQCPGVPDEVLDPIQTWKNKQDYEAQARQLAGLFAGNFKQYEGLVSEEVIQAGPTHS